VASHCVISLDVDAESLNNCVPVCKSCEKQRLGTRFAKGAGDGLSQGSADLLPGMSRIACLIALPPLMNPLGNQAQCGYKTISTSWLKL